MSDSLDRFSGKKSSLCGSGPEDPESVPPGIPTINVAMYDQGLCTYLWDNSGPLSVGAIGTNDFSFECWYKHQPQAGMGLNYYHTWAGSPGGGTFCGWWPASGANSTYFGLGFNGTNLVGTFGTGVTPPGTAYTCGTAASILEDLEWHHLALTCDRSGLMRLYVDAVQMASVDISAIVATNISAALRLTPFNCRLTYNGAGGPVTPVGTIATVAYHLGVVLTPAQITSAYRGRTVNNVAGTLVKYTVGNYWLSELSLYDADTNTGCVHPVADDVGYILNTFIPDQIMYRFLLYSYSGPTERMVMIDESGNGRHMLMNNLTFNRWFAYDPSWEKG